MYNIALVNMPFASLEMLSIALMQLKSLIDAQFANQVSVGIHYVNQDFGKFLGVPQYSQIAKSLLGPSTGLGDWFFKKAAFPEQPDDPERYFRRFFPVQETFKELQTLLLQKREELDSYLESIIGLL